MRTLTNLISSKRWCQQSYPSIKNSTWFQEPLKSWAVSASLSPGPVSFQPGASSLWFLLSCLPTSTLQSTMCQCLVLPSLPDGKHGFVFPSNSFLLCGLDGTLSDTFSCFYYFTLQIMMIKIKQVKQLISSKKQQGNQIASIVSSSSISKMSLNENASIASSSSISKLSSTAIAEVRMVCEQGKSL